MVVVCAGKLRKHGVLHALHCARARVGRGSVAQRVARRPPRPAPPSGSGWGRALPRVSVRLARGGCGCVVLVLLVVMLLLLGKACLEEIAGEDHPERRDEVRGRPRARGA
jgi:hypothetical protein